MNSNTRTGGNTVLWMGDVDEHMDQQFLLRVFSSLNEPVEYVRVMRPKDGSVQGYAFISFRDEESAQRVLNSLSGKPIPGCDGKRFKLNASSRSQQYNNSSAYQYNSNQFMPHNRFLSNSPAGKATGPPPARSRNTVPDRRPGLTETFTAYIGELTNDVGDEEFGRLFRERYKSVYSAHIMRHPDGSSKQFAFVRFNDESEYKEALAQEGHISSMLGCQIRICKAHPKNPSTYRRNFNGQPPADMTRSPVPMQQSVSSRTTPTHFTSDQQQQQRLQTPPSQSSGRTPVKTNGLLSDALLTQQSSPSGLQSLQSQMQQPQAAQYPEVMQPFYYVPVTGYPPYNPDVYWSNSWPDMYSAMPTEVPVMQPLYGQTQVAVMPGGDAAAYQSFPQTAGWPQMPLSYQLQYPYQLLQSGNNAAAAATAAGAPAASIDQTRTGNDQQ